jgi:hypothetical protein
VRMEVVGKEPRLKDPYQAPGRHRRTRLTGPGYRINGILIAVPRLVLADRDPTRRAMSPADGRCRRSNSKSPIAITDEVKFTYVPFSNEVAGTRDARTASTKPRRSTGDPECAPSD